MNPLEKAWTRKYAPQSIDKVILSEDVRQKLTSLTALPTNMILLGEAGIGKSTLTKLLVEKFAPNSNLYLNGSEENGIDTVRNKITDFISVKSFDDAPKVVRIEEFDGFSKAAQNALREIMEANLDDTSFLLTGNEEHKIITPIMSRCAQFRLMPDITSVKNLVVSILKAEGITVAEDQKPNLVALIKRYFPDIRKTVNELQACCTTGAFVFMSKSNNVAEQIIQMISEKKSVFDVRQFVITSADDFGNDYHSLMRDLFDHYAKVKDIRAVRDIPEFMYRCAFVADQEVNFAALLFKICQ